MGKLEVPSGSLRGLEGQIQSNRGRRNTGYFGRQQHDHSNHVGHQVRLLYQKQSRNVGEKTIPRFRNYRRVARLPEGVDVFGKYFQCPRHSGSTSH